MGLELVKLLIIRGMVYIFTQTHIKSFTPNTPYIPFKENVEMYGRYTNILPNNSDTIIYYNKNMYHSILI